MSEASRLLIALALATAAAIFFDHRSERRGLLPAGFRQPWRRMAACVLLTLFFLSAVFVPLVTVDLLPAPEIESLSYGQLFGSHMLLLGTLTLWCLLAFAGTAEQRHRDHGRLASELEIGPPLPIAPPAAAGGWARQLGLRAARPLAELRLGLIAGAGAWAAVLLAALALGLLLQLAGYDQGLGAGPPSPLIVWMAGLPVLVRLLLSASAGLFEELFFRGFLQPRIGVLWSTALFVIGHLGYGQPMMLFGLTVLSLIYAGLARLRGNIWSAVVAHTLFDAVQLLVIIPAALEALEAAGQAA